ncbi:hypothetical protein MHM88_14245 [Epibacterium sp. MM17-32]|uniref:hypothetical protein n=1 Tax=Epibacterium sp. MM17-32 TaxID=2917734 RepID=UPI001EF6A280|nr:hypothetical protein [Epibacterium sp. MM17-32]MCG7628968.1 hypothetical protein [Epibacterium sp. MM17-32]
MMTPELKQDLDNLMTFVAEQAGYIHDLHGVEMGAIKVDIAYGEEVERCEDCDCELAEEAAPVIQSLDDVQTIVTELFADFTETVEEAKEELEDGLKLLSEEADQAGLSGEAVGMLVLMHGMTAGKRLEELFAV